MRMRSVFIVVLWATLFFLPAEVFAASLLVSWNMNTDADLAGYKVYYGTQSGKYSGYINVDDAVTCRIQGLTCGTTYYIAVAAYDIYNNESRLSAEKTVTIPAQVQAGGLKLLSPLNGATLHANPVFSWSGKGFSSFNVYLSTDGKRFSKIYSGSGTSCSMQDSLWSLFIPSGTTLTWYVEGFTTTSKTVQSPAVKFIKG